MGKEVSKYKVMDKLMNLIVVLKSLIVGKVFS